MEVAPTPIILVASFVFFPVLYGMLLFACPLLFGYAESDLLNRCENQTTELFDDGDSCLQTHLVGV